MQGVSSVLLSWIVVVAIAYMVIKLFPKRDPADDVSSEDFEEEMIAQRRKEDSFAKTVRESFHLPPVKDGVIVLSHMRSLVALEVSQELTRHGYHLLIGAQPDTDQTLLQGRKGIEFMKFNMYDPSTFPDLIYRLRVIDRDLQRPLSALVIDLAHSLEKLEEEEEKGEKKTAVDLLEMKSIDNVYKSSFSSPIKTILALFELVKHQRKENPSSANDNKSEEDEEEEEVDESSLFNAHGFRIILLVRHYEKEDCSLHCILQQAFIDYALLLTRANLARNFSVSIIPLSYRTTKVSSSQRQSSNQPFIPWALDLSDDDEAGERVEESKSDQQAQEKENPVQEASKSLLHALVSSSPDSHYPVGHSSILPPFTSNPQKNKSKSQTPPPSKGKSRPKRSSSQRSFNPYERYQRPKRSSTSQKR